MPPRSNQKPDTSRPRKEIRHTVTIPHDVWLFYQDESGQSRPSRVICDVIIKDMITKLQARKAEEEIIEIDHQTGNNVPTPHVNGSITVVSGTSTFKAEVIKTLAKEGLTVESFAGDPYPLHTPQPCKVMKCMTVQARRTILRVGRFVSFLCHDDKVTRRFPVCEEVYQTLDEIYQDSLNTKV